MAMVRRSENHVPGSRPANQAEINRSWSGPEGGGLMERRLPCRGPRSLSPLWLILLDYTITSPSQSLSPRGTTLKPTWGAEPSRS